MVKKVHTSRRLFRSRIHRVLCNYVRVLATISRNDYESPCKIRRTILIYIPINSVAFFLYVIMQKQSDAKEDVKCFMRRVILIAVPSCFRETRREIFQYV